MYKFRDIYSFKIEVHKYFSDIGIKVLVSVTVIVGYWFLISVSKWFTVFPKFGFQNTGMILVSKKPLKYSLMNSGQCSKRKTKI